MRPPVCQRLFKDDDLRRHGCVIASLAWIRREAGRDGTSEPRMRRYRAEAVGLGDFRKRGTLVKEAAKAAALPYPGDRVPPLVRVIIGGSFERDIAPDLAKGAWVLAWVDYAIVQDAGKGVGSFRGGHGVVYARDDGATIVVIDPLRKQVTRWPRELAIKAVERFGSKKRINALSIRYSPTHVEEIERYRGLMQKARRQRDDYRARLLECEAGTDGTPESVLGALRSAATESDRVATNLTAAAADLKRQATALRAVVTTQE